MELTPPRAGELIGDSADRRIEILCDDDALHATWSRFGPRRNGASLHVHHHHADLFYVLAGELTVGLGLDGGAVVPAGTLVYVPPLVVHGFRNAADADVRYLNFHAPGRGFADYLRAGRDGTEGSFDQAEPPADGGRSPEAARIGEAALVADEIEIHERVLEPGAALDTARGRRLLCLYVLEGSLALADDVQAEAGTWVRLSEPRALACAGRGPVRFLEIHV
jgi:mannose-6-phosphate isomerase-like protein (cupin superfamily)